ncbi:hypothetical protein ACS0TY_002646 [Phlomoides rotata]
MGEEEDVGLDNLLWDDQSWAFPDSDDGKRLAAEDVEAPPPAAKGKKRSTAEEGDDIDHELHIWTERERRKKMRNMFATLQALLPHIPPKADKSTIVDEAVKHIKKLQQSVEELEKRKLEMRQGIITHNYPITRPRDPSSFITQQTPAIQSREAFLADQGSNSSPKPLFPGPEYPAIFKTWSSSNVVLNVCGKDAHISICRPKTPGLLTLICFVIEKHNLEVVSAQVSSDPTRCIYMIHTRANGGSDHHQFQQAFVEEIYRQAAAELMMWVNSY